MTEGLIRSTVRPPVADPPGPIASHLALDSDRLGRTYRRRRLGLLTGVLAVVLGAGVLFAPADEAPVTVAAGSATVQAQTTGEPVTLSAIVAETTSTLLEATTTTTSSTVPETTTTEAPTTTSEATTTTVAPTTAPPTTAPPATAARRSEPTAPPATSPPATSPPTTAPPATSPPTTAGTTGDYEYGDPRGTQVWLDLAQCESGGNWSINTGNGYYGGLQFALSTWQSVGGSGYPHQHPRATQIEFGRRLQARQGWGAWPHCSAELGLR